MINHPRPAVLARNLRQLADRLDDEGDRAMRQAPILAARGWPTTTNGTDGGRSSDPTSSTERAALKPGPFDGIDEQLAQQLNLTGHVVNRIHDSLDIILTHASDDDPIRPGSGPCRVDACHHICNPAKNQDDRLRSKYCPSCYKRYLRMGKPDKTWFERVTGPSFT
jgi:hypothetical protein